MKPNDVWMKRLRGGIRVSLSRPYHQNLCQAQWMGMVGVFIVQMIKMILKQSV